MKRNVINVMNFVRCCDERSEYIMSHLFEFTEFELDLVNEFGFENTFLLQYDTCCDERFVKLFREKMTDKTELGLWYEIVEPMTSAVGLPYRSEKGWKWDWHIVPGLPMGYTPKQRELLFDETMRKFKEVWGHYPRTIGGWLIDTYTMNYAASKYDIDAFVICRDQINTDAYTLVGGYFNGGYYPSKNNIFTPAQNKENALDVPVIRLLGPSPIFNYDSKKFLSEDMKKVRTCYTIEPVWYEGYTPACVDWIYKSYFTNENLGFSAIQIGQENSFANIDFRAALRMQFEKAKKLADEGKVIIEKYCDTGRWFKDTFKGETPATAVSALDNWDELDLQSVYYDCKNYTANIFRKDKSVFIRSLYLFDERIRDYYTDVPCETFDAVYENLPIVDTVLANKDETEDIGLVIDTEGCVFDSQKSGEGELTVSWADKKVIFDEDSIKIVGSSKLTYRPGNTKAKITISGDCLEYEYKGNEFRLRAEGGKITENSGKFIIEGENITLKPERK